MYVEDMIIRASDATTTWWSGWPRDLLHVLASYGHFYFNLGLAPSLATANGRFWQTVYLCIFMNDVFPRKDMLSI